MDLDPVFVGIFFVHLSGGKCVGAAVFLCVLAVKCRGESTDDFESRSGLAGCVGSPVEGPAGFLLAASSEHCHNIAGILIGHCHGNIRLRRKLIVILIGILRPHDGLAEGFDILLCPGLGRVHDAVVLVLLHKIRLHTVAVVIGLGAVRRCDGQGIVEIILSILGEVAGFLTALLVDDRLDAGVLCGVDPESAAVEQAVGLGFGERLSVVEGAVLHEVFILKIPQDLTDQRVDEIGVGLVIHLFLFVVDGVDRFVYILLQSILVLLVRDVALREHMVEDDFLTLPVVFGILDWIIGTGILCDAGEHSALRNGQVRGVLVKISLRGGLDAEGVVAEVDRVEVIQENFRLVHGLFELVGQILLLDLALDTLLRGLTGPVGEDIVLDQLLCDGTGAFGEIKAVGNTDIDGSEDTRNIDSSVLVKTLILYRDKGVLKIERNPFSGDWDPVGIGRDQSGSRLPGFVIDESGIALGADIDAAYIRRNLKNAFVGAVDSACSDDTDSRHCRE